MFINKWQIDKSYFQYSPHGSHIWNQTHMTSANFGFLISTKDVHLVQLILFSSFFRENININPLKNCAWSSFQGQSNVKFQNFKKTCLHVSSLVNRYSQINFQLDRFINKWQIDQSCIFNMATVVYIFKIGWKCLMQTLVSSLVGRCVSSSSSLCSVDFSEKPLT